MLDTLLMGVAFAVVGMWAAGRWGGVTSAGFSLKGTPALVTILATLLFGFVYYWLCEGIFGATLGKGILGIAVRQKDGGACTLSASLVRNLVRVIDAVAVYLVGFLVAILSNSRQRLGDHLAKTIVVSRGTGKPARVALVLGWLVLCGGGLTGAYLLHRGAPSAMAVAVQPEARASTVGDLRFVNVALLESEDGPVRAEAPYKPGDTVYLKYDIVGFTSDTQGKIDLFLEAEARDPNGVSMHPRWEKELVQSVPAGRPVNGSFSAGLPSFAPSGTYTIQLKVRDAVKNSKVESAPVFRVEAPAAAPAAGLEIRDFAFSLSKDGPPEEAPVLQGGGTIYMRWRIFGMEAKEGKVNLRVALQVAGPGGSLVVNEPKYVVVDESYYYRPPTFCLPMSGYLTLPATFAKGTYTAQHTVTDEVARAEIRHAAKFELR